MVFIAIEIKAQNEDNPWAVNLNGNLNQYDGDLGNEIFSLGTPGVSIGPELYLNRSFNGYWTIGIDGVSYESFEKAFIDTQIGLNYKLNNGYIISESSKVKPYLTAGIGNVLINQEGRLNLPFGAGLRFELQEGIDLRVAGVYNKMTDNSFSYFQNTIGVVVYTGKKRKPKDSDGDGIADINDDCPGIAGIAARNGCPKPADSDNDGVPDDEDTCPQVAGVSLFNGCPDTDGDGVQDSEDKCPSVRGSKATNGCPDADGDGIVDSADKCPKIAGPQRTKGCPDSDGDGITDKEDRCPNVSGIAANKGCPEIDDEVQKILAEALEGVQFESGRDVIKRSSYSKLDNVAKIMQSHSEFKLTISGYTDNTGNPDSNLALSDRRAKAAKQYLVDKGIDGSRISAKGYGIANPVADNATAAGRAKNRRVEFKVEF